MNIKIDTNFRFSVASMQYLPSGELSITLVSDASSADAHYQYAANLGSGQAQEKPSVSLLQYARDFAAAADIKDKTKDTYRLMGIHLEAYGDRPIDRVTTAYLEGFVRHLQGQGLKAGTVSLYFQKMACVLHEAYRNGLFDDRICWDGGCGESETHDSDNLRERHERPSFDGRAEGAQPPEVEGAEPRGACLRIYGTDNGRFGVPWSGNGEGKS